MNKSFAIKHFILFDEKEILILVLSLFYKNNVRAYIQKLKK